MARTDIQVNFRIPSELKDRLEQSARASGSHRTLTAEIVDRLTASYYEEDKFAQDLQRQIQSLQDLQDQFKHLREEFSGMLGKTTKTSRK